MEILDTILSYINQYEAYALAALIPLLDVLMRKVETKKPFSLIDKILDVIGYGLFTFGLGPLERFVKKIRELFNRLIPERLKSEE